MRNLGLTIFAIVSLVVHVTAAAYFINQPEKFQEEKGAGATALEVGSLFESRTQHEVEAQELEDPQNTPRELEQTPVDRAIPVKTFVQEDVKPLPTQRTEPKPLEVREAKAVAEPLLEELTANEALAKPEIFKPREVKPVETKKVEPKKKIREVKATKPKPVKKVKKVVKKVKKKPKKVVKAKKSDQRKKAQKASTTRRKGAAKANKKGRKGATGGSGGKNTKASGRHLATNYAGKVRRKVLRKQRYPKQSLRRREKGTATIRFRVSANGRMSGLALVRSSGKPRLDKEALAMARRAAPFPAFPQGMSRAPRTITLPIRFVPRR